MPLHLAVAAFRESKLHDILHQTQLEKVNESSALLILTPPKLVRFSF